MSYLLTIFFLFFLNILGLAPLGFNVTGNITTLSLALITYLITTLLQIKNYWSHMDARVPVILRPVLALIELLGTIIKPFSLMIVCMLT
jgi:F-type H+-transporting ATPase subunit a